VVQAIHVAVDAQWRERDGADREFDHTAGEPDAAADVSAETPDDLIRSSNSFDNAELPVGGLMTLNGWASRYGDHFAPMSGTSVGHGPHHAAYAFNRSRSSPSSTPSCASDRSTR
jgi:hypothetical protein